MAANFGSDPWLDARLRNVPLPIGMLGRLSQVANVSDEQLDAAVREVPVPDELGERLQLIAEMPRWQRLGARAARRPLAIGAGRFAADGYCYWIFRAGRTLFRLDRCA